MNPGSAPIKFAKTTYNDEGVYTFVSSLLAARTLGGGGINDFITDNIQPKVATVQLLDTLSEKFKQRANIRIPATLNVGIMVSRGNEMESGYRL